MTMPVSSPLRALPALLLAPLFLGCTESAGHGRSPQRVGVEGYARDAECMACHQDAAASWQGPHHDRAMEPADPTTVLGDFDDTTFEDSHQEARFTREGDSYFCTTEGPDGRPETFRILYTFGVEPLQQYLVALPGGRLQCLSVAWDTEAGRWFSLYPDEGFEPGDPLHWTGRQQNWNTMCADCHSTHLSKNYDSRSDAFATTWAEIDVGCQACHGPGAEHVAWARSEGGAESQGRYGLRTELSRAHPASQVRACAPCHSRRLRLAEDIAPTGELLDSYMLELLSPGSYHADGQIDGEVYVLGSFLQSKMHARGVSCSDCHDPHSLELVAQGNALCLQCHGPHAPIERFPTLTTKNYDGPEHHFHPMGGAGSACVDCHMPSKNYMVVDPRPDLSLEHGTPNACNGCHDERDAAWAVERLEQWYGPREALTFEDTLTAARSDPIGTLDSLRALELDRDAPAIARASAFELTMDLLPLDLQQRYAALDDPAPLVRLGALRGLEVLPTAETLETLLPLLHDPVRAVRIQAARALAGVSPTTLDPEDREAFVRGLAEFEEVQRYSADMPASWLNLGVLKAARGEFEGAIADYRRSLEIDPWFLMARFNLASTLSAVGRSAEAVDVLRRGVELAPDEPEMHYSLGLALGEVGRLEEAAKELCLAADALPGDPKKQRNAAVACHKLGRVREAEVYYMRAHRSSPEDPELLHNLLMFLLQQGELERSRVYAERLAQLVPGPETQALLERVDRELAVRSGG